MYAYLFFGLSLLGIFSIFENFKGGQKLSFFKINVIVFLSLITIASGFDFLYELGYDYNVVRAFIRIFGFFAFTNLYYLVALHKIPKAVKYIEISLIIIYSIGFMKGFRLISIYKGQFTNNITFFNKLHFVLLFGFVIFSMIYNLYVIHKRTENNNLYQLKIKKWASLLVLTLILVIALVLGAVLLYFKNGRGEILDTRTAFIALRFILILFILFRPRFIDESGVAFKFKNSGPSVGKISLSNFELLFFGNQYFLRSEGNLENFALMLNQPKLAVSTFVKENFKDSFGELMNKNRVNYFKSLLQSKQHESFTIEALSEMAGFKNRQSMYNSFKKYEGNSPSDYLNNL